MMEQFGDKKEIRMRKKSGIFFIGILIFGLVSLAYVDSTLVKYYVNASETDQGATGNGRSIKAYVDAIGTDKSATIVLIHNGVGNTTEYTLTTSEMISSNIELEIENGAILDGAGTLTPEGPFEAGQYQVFGTSITVAFGDTSVTEVRPVWWGAVGDDNAGSAAVNTAAIDAAFATGKNVRFGTGTFHTTGNHRIAARHQHVYGSHNTILEKSTNATCIIDTVFAQNYIGLHDIYIDGGGFTGAILIWRGHYSIVENVTIVNTDDLDYGLYITGSNLSNFTNVSSDGMLIDQSSDPAYAPTYGCLYSNFENLTLTTTDGAARSSLKMVGDLILNLTFTQLYIESFLLTESSIYINGSNIGNISFLDFNAEFSLDTNPFIEIANSVVYNIHFISGKLATNAALTKPFFDITSCSNFTIANMLLWDLVSAAGNTVIKLTSTISASFEKILCNITNNFNFIESGDANNYYITTQGNTNKGAGVGTNEWGVANYISVTNSEFVQVDTQVNNMTILGGADRHSQIGVGFITVADDAYYDVYGDGGANNPGGDTSGFLKIGSGGVTDGSEANAALLYVQAGGSNLSAKATSISAGANIEIDVLNDADAALATTTDGKLGIQVGGGNDTQKFIRIYNRTAGSLTLYVHLDRMF